MDKKETLGEEGSHFSSGLEPTGGFRESFTKNLGAASTRMHDKVLVAAWLETPLGPMLAIADEEQLYLLEFVERRGLEEEVERMQKKLNLPIIQGRTQPINIVEGELKEYFAGTLVRFKTPIKLLGTAFQILVWEQLQKIPYGETRSYTKIAEALGRPQAFRAVAQANSCNQLAIIVPCHRVINTNGELGGYAGGVTRKKWMLDHEKEMGHGS